MTTTTPEIWFKDWLEPGQTISHAHKRSHAGYWIMGLTFSLVVGVGVASVTEGHNSQGDSTPTKTSNMVDPAQQDMQKRIMEGMLYDRYEYNAEVLAETGDVAGCETWVVKLAKVAMGPISFDCTL